MKQMKSITYLLVITTLLAVVYIAESNSLSVQGYIIAENEKDLDKVQQSYTELNTQVAQYNSIGNVGVNPAVADMETTQFVYISEDGALVKK
jgi:hypothetical protein